MSKCFSIVDGVRYVLRVTRRVSAQPGDVGTERITRNVKRILITINRIADDKRAWWLV